MDPRPLLYLCARPQRDAAQAEWASFRVAMGRDTDGLHAWDLVADPLPHDALERYAGFVVGGSPFNVTTPDKGAVQTRVEYDLARVAEAAASGETRAMFTCYGIGVVTRVFGGAVADTYPEGTRSKTVALTDAGRHDPVFRGLPERFEAFTAHKEGTDILPPDAVLLATNEDCPVQAYRVGESLYTTQFHPELTPQDFTARMRIYRDGGYFDPSEFDAVAARVLASPVTEPARILHAFARL